MAAKRSSRKGTTRPGYINKHGSSVVRSTGLAGTDHGKTVYVLRCPNGHEYRSNGSDIWQRKCPSCQGGRAGLSY